MLQFHQWLLLDPVESDTSHGESREDKGNLKLSQKGSTEVRVSSHTKHSAEKRVHWPRTLDTVGSACNRVHLLTTNSGSKGETRARSCVGLRALVLVA